MADDSAEKGFSSFSQLTSKDILNEVAGVDASPNSVVGSSAEKPVTDQDKEKEIPTSTDSTL